MSAYYNEHDPKAAAWLRELIRQGLIAPGEVDERSIEDVVPNELARFTQCHFFAGIGVWSYALRQAGWPDDRPVWTGSCPCQPFSAAGKRGGTADERHIWPAFFHLIRVCRPDVVFGEQVASKDGLAWLDIVRSDLEGENYVIGAADLCAAGFGAPHIRQRLYWVADVHIARLEGHGITRNGSREWTLGPSSLVGGMADDKSDRRIEREQIGSRHCGGDEEEGQPRRAAESCCSSGMADTEGSNGRLPIQSRRSREADFELERNGQDGIRRARETNGFWRDADWLTCRDAKWRPVEPGTFPLVNGTPARVGRLRGYGNAIVAPVAQAFIEAYLALEDHDATAC